MSSLNCSGCGGSSTSLKLNLSRQAKQNKAAQNPNQNLSFKGNLNCSSCGGSSSIGNKFNKTV